MDRVDTISEAALFLFADLKLVHIDTPRKTKFGELDDSRPNNC